MKPSLTGYAGAERPMDERRYQITDSGRDNWTKRDKAPLRELLAPMGRRLMAEVAGTAAERGSGLTAGKVPRFGPRQHAILFGLLAKGICDHFGADADALLLNAVEVYGRERGARMAMRCRENGDSTDDMAAYFAYCEWTWSGGGLEKTEPDSERPFVSYRVLQCPWHAAWQESGLGAYGPYYCRRVDRAILRGFNPRLVLTLPERLTEAGGKSCQFNWESAENTDGLFQRQRAMQERLNGRQIKDFQYHTAHLYSAVLRCAYQKDAARAEPAESDARRGFAERCGYEELLGVLEFAGLDFLAV